MVKLHKAQLQPSKRACILHDHRDSVTVVYFSNTEIEISSLFLLRCQFYILVGRNLYRSINHIRLETLSFADHGLAMLMLYGSINHDDNINRALDAGVRYIDASFDYLRIKVETWNSNISFFLFTL